MTHLSDAALLKDGLQQLKLTDDRATVERLLHFAALVLKANQTTNLTGAKDAQSLIVAHILDSLAPLGQIKLADVVADLGSGAGLPGIPAAFMYPNNHFFLLEPRRKRAEFLEFAVSELTLANVEVVKSKATTSGELPKGGVGTVLMRAVAPPAESLGLGLPIVRPGGMLLLYEGRAMVPSLDAIQIAARFHASIATRSVNVPFLNAERHIWIVRRKPISPVRKASIRSSRPRST